jgi:hypothetical protein
VAAAENGGRLSDPIADENLLIHRLFHFPFPWAVIGLPVAKGCI